MPGALKQAAKHLLRPVHLLRGYRPKNVRGDLVAGLTVAVILLPQSIAYAQVAQLPPQYGLNAAIVGAILGALWGSSRHLQTGPTSAISLILLSSLATYTEPGSSEFLLAAGLMTVMAGLAQVALGVARLGMLTNFVSHSVVVGFTAGAAVLIASTQIRPLLGLHFESAGLHLVDTLAGIVGNLDTFDGTTAALGIGGIVVMVGARLVSHKIPAALVTMVVSGLVVALAFEGSDVSVIGELPRGLPPIADIPILDLDLIGKASAGALAIAAIGLTEALSIARSVAAKTGQRLDANQELIGQGLANAGCGVFSGYAGSGSFTRTAVAHESGAQTQMSAVFTGVFVLLAVVALAPAAASVPHAALAGVLMVIAYGMVDRKEIARIWRGTRGDAMIMVATFVATLFLPIEFAVLAGILVSFALYIRRTSEPRVVSVLPDRRFRRLYHQPRKPPCPQLAILDVEGDFYFGAVTQVEEAILRHLKENPEQRFLLLRMHSVNQCDYSGIHCLEGIVRGVREMGGDVFLTRVHRDVDQVMRSTGFQGFLGEDHYILETAAIGRLFHKVLDPAICIYECDVRAFRECQNLPKRPMPLKTGLIPGAPTADVPTVKPETLWKRLHEEKPPVVVDVREPREYRRGHIPGARLVPLPKLVAPGYERPEGAVVFVCRSGRRSSRAAAHFIDGEGDGREVSVLKGGMRAWEAAKLLVAIDAWRHPSRPRTEEAGDSSVDQDTGEG